MYLPIFEIEKALAAQEPGGQKDENLVGLPWDKNLLFLW